MNHLGKNQKIVTKENRDDFIEENKFIKQLLQEFEYIEKRKANHHYYKMIIQDVMWAR